MALWLHKAVFFMESMAFTIPYEVDFGKVQSLYIAKNGNGSGMMKQHKATVLLSSCLLGHPVRYDGRGNRIDDEYLETLRGSFRVIHFCPEVAGGLETPRVPAEITAAETCTPGDDQVKVVTREGADVSTQFLRGAQRTLELCVKENVEAAVLKERSPSCGSRQIYDGTFSGRTMAGAGVTARLLRENGIQVFSEETFEDFLAWAGQIHQQGKGGVTG